MAEVDSEIVSPFVTDVLGGVHAEKGWPSSCYGMSKLSLIAFSRALAAAEPTIATTACCPGWCATDMSSHSGPKTPKQGAATPLLLLTQPQRPTGEFWQEEKAIEW